MAYWMGILCPSDVPTSPAVTVLAIMAKTHSNRGSHTRSSKGSPYPLPGSRCSPVVELAGLQTARCCGVRPLTRPAPSRCTRRTMIVRRRWSSSSRTPAEGHGLVITDQTLQAIASFLRRWLQTQSSVPSSSPAVETTAGRNRHAVRMSPAGPIEWPSSTVMLSA